MEETRIGACAMGTGPTDHRGTRRWPSTLGGMLCSHHAGCHPFGTGRAAQPSTAALHALHTRSVSTPRERVGQETQSGRENQRAAWPGILERKQDTKAPCGDASEIELLGICIGYASRGTLKIEQPPRSS